MQVRDLMQPDGRVFLKSEWGPISDDWPCVSFTKRSVGDRLRNVFQPGRDVVLYAGTTNPSFTEEADHRSRLISAVVVQPSQIIPTKKIVPPASWANKVATHGDRWPHSVAVSRAAVMIGPPFPSAREVTPKAYSSLANIENRGSVAEVFDDERAAAMDVQVHEIILNLTPSVQSFLNLRAGLIDVPLSLKQEVARMVGLIQQRVNSGGEASVRMNPLRFAPNTSELTVILTRIWDLQVGLCALCGGPLVAGTANGMMQVSADRIDSQDGSYDGYNVQLTHLACNLAKNKYGLDHFEEWVAAVRGIKPSAAEDGAQVD